MTALQWGHGRSCAVAPDDSEVWLFGGAGPTRLSGGAVGALARGVNGQRDREQVIDHAVAGGMTADRAAEVLDRWIRVGHLTDQADLDADPEWLMGAAVPNDSDEQAGVLQQLNGTAAAETEFLIVDDLLNAERALAESDLSQPIRLVQLRGDRILVTAPLGDGGQCARCLVERRTTRLAPEFLGAQRAGLKQPPASAQRHRNAARHAAELLQSSSDSAATITAIDPITCERVEHVLVPVPGCPTCDPSGISVVWSHVEDSVRTQEEALLENPGLVGSRTIEPNRTWELHRHVVSDLIGIVPIIEPVGPAELNAFAAGANVVGIDDPAVAASALRNRGGGKGLSPEAARASALAEAIERDALRARGDEPVIVGGMDEIPGAIHPNDIQLFSERQLADADARWDAGTAITSGFHIVPRPFDTERPREWSAVRSLVSGELHYLPTSKLFVRAKRQPGDPSGSSNGAAAGNTLAEAQLQGLLELIERDAVALWWYPRSERPAFDLDAWDDPRVIAARAPHLAHGRTWVLDVTSDIGVPAAVAISLDDRIPFPMLGAGAHVDPAVAVARALSEMAQMKAAVLAGPPITAERANEAENAWFTAVNVTSEPWLIGSGTSLPSGVPSHATAEEARDDVVARLSALGHDVLWADFTRRDSQLPVVRTFAPGLRHFWRRLAPGRLYDVPLAQGWIPAGLGEDDVNPLEIPL
jgi:ribosomal protein S12 methylthiotransferase accessory factor